jgi:uncharacterized RDD family membrane protein YckC
MTGPGPGWFADPAGSGGQRYFDGTAWTEHLAPPPPGYGAWAPLWKGAQLGRPQMGPGALAEPGRRLAAQLLDVLLLFGVLIILCAITIPVVAPHVGPLFPKTPAYRYPAVNPPFPGILWLYIAVLGCAFVTGLISVAYETFFTVRYGRTLGKRWLGLRPVRVDGSRLTFGRALGRSAFRYGMGLLSWFGLLDPLWCLWDDRRQCVHDKVADTIVINDPAAPSGPGPGPGLGP